MQKKYTVTRGTSSGRIGHLEAQKLHRSYQENALRAMLKRVGRHYGATDQEIEREFIDILFESNLKDALVCYQKINYSLDFKQ